MAFVCAWVQAALAADALPDRISADIFAGIKNGTICTDPDAKTKRCVAADATKDQGIAFEARTPSLQPGVYQAVLRLKLAKINNVNSSPLTWKFTVGEAGKGERTFDILMMEKAGVYQEIPCRFVVESPGKAVIAFSWDRRALSRSRGSGVRVEKGEIPKAPSMDDIVSEGQAKELLSDIQVEAMIAKEPPLASLTYLSMAVDEVRVQPVSDIEVARLDPDKIRYNPGEKASFSITLRNYAPRQRTLKVETVLIRDMDDVVPVDARSVTLGPTAAIDLTLVGPAFEKKWGYAVRCRVFEGERQVTEKSEYFTVHDNPWAVLIAGRPPSQWTANVKTREQAAQSAEDNRRKYRNWVESGFWAPDEFGDFTPDKEFWWGGQGQYHGGVTGTKLMIEEGHKKGIAFSVYSDIWGGDGLPAFEWTRRRPDLSYPSTFNVEWLERWEANGAARGTQVRPMHVWPLTIIHLSDPAAIEHHVRELIGTHRMFGWDSVRYDSHAISDGIADVMKKVKAGVRAEEPDFRFGYNSSVVGRKPELAAAFKEHCEGGSMIMEEGIRSFASGGAVSAGQKTYEECARRILDFKEETRENGGHFLAIGFDECFRNDAVYMYVFWLAGNTHGAYDWGNVCPADYFQFATRYAGLIWDLNVKKLQNPETCVDVGEAASFLWLWKDYVHLRDLGGGKRQLIVHLINSPVDKSLFTSDECNVPPVRENVRLTVKPPAGATVKNVWFLTPEYELTQKNLDYRTENGAIAFTVPRIRFWSTAVVELDGGKFGSNDAGADARVNP
jgi:hypothetical protein